MNKIKFAIPIVISLFMFTSCMKPDETPPYVLNPNYLSKATAMEQQMNNDLDKLTSAMQVVDCMHVLDCIGPDDVQCINYKKEGNVAKIFMEDYAISIKLDDKTYQPVMFACTSSTPDAVVWNIAKIMCNYVGLEKTFNTSKEINSWVAGMNTEPLQIDSFEMDFVPIASSLQEVQDASVFKKPVADEVHLESGLKESDINSKRDLLLQNMQSEMNNYDEQDQATKNAIASKSSFKVLTQDEMKNEIYETVDANGKPVMNIKPMANVQPKSLPHMSLPDVSADITVFPLNNYVKREGYTIPSGKHLAQYMGELNANNTHFEENYKKYIVDGEKTEDAEHKSGGFD